MTTEFLQILAGTMMGASPASSSEPLPVESPAVSDDDTLEDEIGFEDLSEFLTQVIVPGATPLPPPAPSDENTLEMDFSQSGGDSSAAAHPMDLTSLIHSLTAGEDSKALQQRDPVIGADTSLLRDALAAESLAAAALQDTGVDSLSFADTESSSQQITFSPLHAAPMHSTHTSTQAPVELKSPVGTQQWADELGTKLTWMANQGRESASLTLSPEHLGPIEVKISVQDGQASVWFGAQHADTRSAIEQALPRLRDLFSAQGLSLADSGVFREAPRQQQPQPFSGASRGGSAGEETAVVSSVTKRGNGILDLYA